MLFPVPNQQCQITEGICIILCIILLTQNWTLIDKHSDTVSQAKGLFTAHELNWKVDPVTWHVHWQHTQSLWLCFALIVCSETMMISAREVLNTCSPVWLFTLSLQTQFREQVLRKSEGLVHLCSEWQDKVQNTYHTAATDWPSAQCTHSASQSVLYAIIR